MTPHEQLAADAREGRVPPGWTPKCWADRLEQLAGRCESLHPDRAGTYREWARKIRRAILDQSNCPDPPHIDDQPAATLIPPPTPTMERF